MRNRLTSSRPREPSRSALSLLEVMIAVTFLAVALVGIVGSYQNLDQARRTTDETARAQAVIRSIMDRVSSAAADQLGTAELPWSVDRGFEAITGSAPPLSENAAAADDLLDTGLLMSPTGLRNVRVYLEYYRGETDPVFGPGLMDETYPDPARYNPVTEASSVFISRFSGAGNASWRAARRLAANAAPAVQVPEDSPFAVRVLVTWGDDDNLADGDQNAGRLQVFLAKRRPSGL